MQYRREARKHRAWHVADVCCKIKPSIGPASLRDGPAAEIVEAVNDAVGAFTEGAPAAEDITVVAVRRL